MLKKQNKNFISEIDLFLADFDAKHPESSSSQNKEINKHQRIAHLRDNEQRDENENNIWEGF